MNRQRIEHFIQVMRDVQARDATQSHSHFNMSHWVFIPNDDNVCDTVACALGWLALSPEANAQGLIMDVHWESPMFNKVHGAPAGALYLDIDIRIADSLFFAEAYVRFPHKLVKPQNIIDRLEYLLQVDEDEYLREIRDEISTLSIPGGCDYQAGEQA